MIGKWKNIDGEWIEIAEMEAGYVLNCIRMIERVNREWVTKDMRPDFKIRKYKELIKEAGKRDILKYL